MSECNRSVGARRYKANLTAEQRERKREKDRRLRMRKKLKMRLDPELYAKYRSDKRARNKRWRDKTRKRRYHESRARRIPDWATLGQDILDKRSVFLWNNANTQERAWQFNF